MSTIELALQAISEILLREAKELDAALFRNADRAKQSMNTLRYQERFEEAMNVQKELENQTRKMLANIRLLERAAAYFEDKLRL